MFLIYECVSGSLNAMTTNQWNTQFESNFILHLFGWLLFFIFFFIFSSFDHLPKSATMTTNYLFNGSFNCFFFINIFLESYIQLPIIMVYQVHYMKWNYIYMSMCMHWDDELSSKLIAFKHVISLNVIKIRCHLNDKMPWIKFVS